MVSLVSTLVLAVIAWTIFELGGQFSPVAVIALLSLPPIVLVRTIVVEGRAWFAAPGGFPNLYVFVSTGLGAVAHVSYNADGTYEAFGVYEVRDGYNGLFALTAAAFALGCLAAGKGRAETEIESEKRSRTAHEPVEVTALGRTDNPKAATILKVGRWTLVLSILYQIFLTSVTSLDNRGSGQDTASAWGVVSNADVILTPAAVILLLVGASIQGNKLFAKRLDLVLVITDIALILIRGERGTASQLLIVLVIWTAMRGRLRTIWLAAFGVLTFTISAVVAVYRSGGSFSSLTLSRAYQIWDVTIGSSRDVLALVYTLVPAQYPHTGFGTYWASVERLVPSPIALPLFGQFSETGAFKFRQLMNYTNADNGFNFSLPGQAYLSFGIVGLVIVTSGVAGLLSKAWLRASSNNPNVMTVVYISTLAAFTVIWRSDSGALFKIPLYTAVFAWIVFSNAQRPRSSPAQLRHSQKNELIDT